jgi:hypothetical protein
MRVMDLTSLTHMFNAYKAHFFDAEAFCTATRLDQTVVSGRREMASSSRQAPLPTRTWAGGRSSPLGLAPSRGGDDGRPHAPLTWCGKISRHHAARCLSSELAATDGNVLMRTAPLRETPALYRMNIDGSHKTVVIQDVRL